MLLSSKELLTISIMKLVWQALRFKTVGYFYSFSFFPSQVKGTFGGEERDTFSYITSLVNPGQKRIADDGPWLKQPACDIMVTHHYGGAMKVYADDVIVCFLCSSAPRRARVGLLASGGKSEKMKTGVAAEGQLGFGRDRHSLRSRLESLNATIPSESCWSEWALLQLSRISGSDAVRR